MAAAVGAETAATTASADPRSLLNQLDRHPAGQKHETVARLNAGPAQRARELVQRIVAADVLAQGDEPLRRRPKCRRMNRMRLALSC